MALSLIPMAAGSRCAASAMIRQSPRHHPRGREQPDMPIAGNVVVVVGGLAGGSSTIKEGKSGPSEGVGELEGKSKDLNSGSVNKRSNELAFAHKQPILSARLISTGLILFFSLFFPHLAELLRALTHET